jgi:hypothetical protein
MLLTTGTALVLNFVTFVRLQQTKPSAMNLTNATIAVVLLLLSIYVAIEAARVLVKSRRGDQKDEGADDLGADRGFDVVTSAAGGTGVTSTYDAGR